jgi:hypothetical protein
VAVGEVAVSEVGREKVSLGKQALARKRAKERGLGEATKRILRSRAVDKIRWLTTLA